MIEIRHADGEHVLIEEAEAAGTLLELLREHGIPIAAECDGKGNCGRCRVRFLKGVPEPSEKEKRLLSGELLGDGVRLACEVSGPHDCVVQIAERREKIQVLTEGKIPRDGESAAVSEDDSGDAGASVREDGKDYGAAIDIGTTTLAAVLVRLSDGARCGTASAVNGQRAYGADVIARIQAANEGKGAQMRELVCADICTLLEQLCAQAGIGNERLRELVFVGNTVMCHLLRGLSCQGLGAAPFVPEDNSLWEGPANVLLGTTAWEAEAVVFPGISAFVGADLVAGIYATGLDTRDAPCMLIDIGTNGEMVLGSREGFLVTSAAAGPVFEGGNISCGVPGIPGAVSHVKLSPREKSGIGCGAVSPDAFACSYETIGGRHPVGLCGTGIVDITGELLAHGLMDENGTLADAWFAEGVPVAGDTVRFTQSDIRQIQMGKSAIRAGIETLLDEYQKRLDPGGDMSAAGRIPVYLAGGFGYDMDVAQAIRIGMFPASFAECVTPVGNSALEGAVRFLAEERCGAAKRLERIVKNAGELNLAMHPQFNERYLKYMFF